MKRRYFRRWVSVVCAWRVRSIVFSYRIVISDLLVGRFLGVDGDGNGDGDGDFVVVIFQGMVCDARSD